VQTQPEHPRLQEVLAEVQARMTAVYPEAQFQVRTGEETAGIYMDVYKHADDGFCVLELVSDWLVDLSVEEGLDIHVVPLPPGPG
jgi:uncharacterized membrane protein